MTAETVRVYNATTPPVNWTWEKGFETSDYQCQDGYYDDGGVRAASGSAYEGNYIYRCQGGGGLLYHDQVAEVTNFGTQIFFCLDNSPSGQGEVVLAVAAKSTTCTDDDPCENDCDYSLQTPPGSITGNGSVILSFVYEDAQEDSERLSLYVYNSNGSSVFYQDSFALPSPIQGYTHPSTGGDGGGWAGGDWIGIRMFMSDNIIRVYFWLYHYQGWMLAYTSPVINWGNYRPSLRCPAFWGAFMGSDTAHFDAWKYGSGLTISDYSPTKMEFYLEESNVGGGYMVLPIRNVDFSSYYHLQEQEFLVTDLYGNALFTGLFDEPQLIKDGVRFNMKEITQQLSERICRRDYSLESGIVAEIGAVP